MWIRVDDHLIALPFSHSAFTPLFFFACFAFLFSFFTQLQLPPCHPYGRGYAARSDLTAAQTSFLNPYFMINGAENHLPLNSTRFSSLSAVPHQQPSPHCATFKGEFTPYSQPWITHPIFNTFSPINTPQCSTQLGWIRVKQHRMIGLLDFFVIIHM